MCIGYGPVVLSLSVYIYGTQKKKPEITCIIWKNFLKQTQLTLFYCNIVYSCIANHLINQKHVVLSILLLTNGGRLKVYKTIKVQPSRMEDLCLFMSKREMKRIQTKTCVLKRT